jgi:hypothetical protein
MANDCFDGHWWFKSVDEEGNFLDYDGNIIYTWMDWTSHMGQAIDDQMCAVREALTAEVEAVSTAVENLPVAGPPTKAQVLSALGAPLSALTPASGQTIATVQVLGLTVIAGSTVTVMQNAITRIAEIEDRLKAVGVLPTP